jgi:hypothetical protein
MSDVACYNCGTPLTGPFCAVCGQKAQPLDLTLHGFLHELGEETLHVDGRIFASVRELFLKPGFLTREYFVGRRARWVSPLRLYLLFSLLYFGILALAGSTGFLLPVKADRPQDADPAVQKLGFSSEQDLRDAVNHARVTWVPRAMFLLVPFLAWLVKVAYRDSGKNYLQHLYFALHLQAAWFGAAALAALPAPIAPQVAGGLTSFVLPAFALLYTVAALRTAYGGSKARAWRRGVVVGAIYGAATVVVTLAIVLPVVFSRTLMHS